MPQVYAARLVTEFSASERGLWVILVFTSVYLVFAAVLAREMRNRQKGYFLKPFQIVYYGLFFGVYGVSVPVILVLSKWGQNMFHCDANLTVVSDLRVITFAYAAFLFLILKLINTLDIIILLLTKCEKQISFGYLMNSVLDPLILYGETNYYPGGIVYFPVFIDITVNMIKYGLSARSCVDGVKPIANWQRLLHNLRLVQYLVATLHSYYALNINVCECPLSLRYFLLTVHFTLAVSYATYWVYGSNDSEVTSRVVETKKHIKSQ